MLLSGSWQHCVGVLVKHWSGWHFRSLMQPRNQFKPRPAAHPGGSGRLEVNDDAVQWGKSSSVVPFDMLHFFPDTAPTAK